MRTQAIKYAMLRKTDEFENDRVEVTIELDRGDAVGDEAKQICEVALMTDAPVETRATFEDWYQRIGGDVTAPMARVEVNGPATLRRKRSGG